MELQNIAFMWWTWILLKLIFFGIQHRNGRGLNLKSFFLFIPSILLSFIYSFLRSRTPWFIFPYFFLLFYSTLLSPFSFTSFFLSSFLSCSLLAFFSPSYLASIFLHFCFFTTFFRFLPSSLHSSLFHSTPLSSSLYVYILLSPSLSFIPFFFNLSFSVLLLPFFFLSFFLLPSFINFIHLLIYSFISSIFPLSPSASLFSSLLWNLLQN